MTTCKLAKNKLVNNYLVKMGIFKKFNEMDYEISLGNVGVE